MNVLHLNTERGWRGGERQTLWLAKALEARGCRSFLAVRPGEPLSERAAEAGLGVVPLTPFFEFDPITVLRLRRVLRDASVDIVHAHTGHAVGLGALAVWRTGAKLVVTRRVDFPLKRHVLTRWKYDRADAVACISNQVQKEVLAGGVPEEKVTLVPSGVDPEGYPSPTKRDRYRQARGLRPDAPVVVHAAALVPHKDQATLLRAAQRMVLDGIKARFFLFGEGPRRASLEKMSRDLGVAGQVEFMGYRTDVLEWVALADVFVLSSKEEGLGTALLDALAMGIPTCATAAGGIPDIYGDPGAPELTPPGDAEALARNIRSVLNDPEEARRRVEHGRERVKLFSVDAMADRYQEIYARLFAPRPSSLAPKEGGHSCNTIFQ